ncbi:MAG: protein kinase [Desulfobacula sp.]|jgi:serine/threonine protein kinase|nr:protein kinase [Desulfobacula sp.]MBT3484336.1 protein kinase [Desulfobacula sp.]MBT3806185.1 protein kinase [Desulfobacula sp.]MBT4024145.1 protein kinase [Desulfobacula sp.]MBT4197469.1 protein kinase [Desulfobacula sp.]
MGEVYRAHQINLKRDVAIKTISEEMLQELEDDPEELEMALKRFQREVQTMAQVRHQNILNIFDYGVQKKGKSDRPDQTRAIEYIVMEYIPGDSLRFTMSDDGRDDDPDLYASWIESYFLAILDGFEAMHHHNIFHRDLKKRKVPFLKHRFFILTKIKSAITCSWISLMQSKIILLSKTELLSITILLFFILGPAQAKKVRLSTSMNGFI